MARSRKAAEDLLWYEIESRGWQEELGDDPMSGVLTMRVQKQDFFDHLTEQAQGLYQCGLGVVWPLNLKFQRQS